MVKPIVIFSRQLPLNENEPAWLELQKLDVAFFAKAPKLKVIGNYGAGCNNVDEVCTARSP